MNINTLEQIKDNQLGLNDLLQLPLTDLEHVMDKIIGVIPEENIKEASPVYDGSGLINDICFAQKDLERKINKLNILKQRLYNSVFKSTDKAINTLSI